MGAHPKRVKPGTLLMATAELRREGPGKALRPLFLFLITVRGVLTPDASGTGAPDPVVP